MYEKQMNAIVECLRLVADSYEGHEQAVLDVIADCQDAMEEEREGGHRGMGATRASVMS
jgi:hypothetical protein